MDNIHDEADDILRHAQEHQKLEAMIEAQREIVKRQDEIIFAQTQEMALLFDTFLPKDNLTPEQIAFLQENKDRVPSMNLLIARIQGLTDQAKAAKDELKILEGE